MRLRNCFLCIYSNKWNKLYLYAKLDSFCASSPRFLFNFYTQIFCYLVCFPVSRYTLHNTVNRKCIPFVHPYACIIYECKLVFCGYRKSHLQFEYFIKRESCFYISCWTVHLLLLLLVCLLESSSLCLWSFHYWRVSRATGKIEDDEISQTTAPKG